MLLKNWMFSLLFFATQLIVVGQAQAQSELFGGGSAYIGGQAQVSTGLAGSGYWGGTQACPYRVKTSKAAVSISDEEKKQRERVLKLETEVERKTAEKDRNEKKLELLKKKVELQFDSSVSEFLLDVHMSGRLCKEYMNNPVNNCNAKATTGDTSAGAVDAQGKAQTAEEKTKCGDGTLVEEPDLLKTKWNKADGTGYCNATSDSSRGSVKASICNDASLRPKGKVSRVSGSGTSCSTTLNDYRKTLILIENAAAFIEEAKAEIEERTALAEIANQEFLDKKREKEAKAQTEGGCATCALYGRNGGYERPERDWLSTFTNVGVGLGLMIYGKKSDEAAREENAQLGFQSTHSYGYPYFTAGAASVINGIAGPGAYGCGGGYSGAGFPYGAAGSYGANGVNGYGPFAGNGGAFSYPQNMYGSPWGGGMYNPGYGANGLMNGPNGGLPYGLNGQLGIGIPANGQFGGNGQFGNNGLAGAGALCLTWPCNTGVGASGQIGIPANGQFGLQTNGLQINGLQVNGGLNGNYQLQMLQQQQAMLQQQAQQQAQMAQYYQAQAQAQMQAYQRQQMVQQQATEVTQQIQALQARLNMLVSGAYNGSSYNTGLMGGGSLGTGFSGGLSLGGSIYLGAASATQLYNPTLLPGTSATIPGIGTGIRTGR